MENKQPASVAAMLTSYNRAETTLRCLKGLYAQAGLSEAFTLDIYLFDDGSPDGTAQRVADAFPRVMLETGDGSSYWNGGMRRAFDKAMAHGYDFYLWVNDDTHLYENAVAELLQTYRTAGPEAVIVGNIEEPGTGRLSYGGLITPDTNKLRGVSRPPVGGAPGRCDTMNGNCVLIPDAVARRVGNLDETFTHKMADMDYGYRCGKAGAQIWATGRFVGECERHGQKEAWLRPDATLRERFRALTGPKGLPVREWRVFCRRYAGPLWPLYWAGPYLKALVRPRG